MATIKNKKTKLVTIESYGSISELGGINGPIVHPCRLDLDVIIRMVNTNKKVFEVNPANTNEKVRLSLSNVRSENFKPVVVKPTVKAATAPKATETSKVAENKATTETKATSDFTKK